MTEFLTCCKLQLSIYQRHIHKAETIEKAINKVYYKDSALLDWIGLWSGLSADTMNERIHHRPTSDKVIEIIGRTDLIEKRSPIKWKH